METVKSELVPEDVSMVLDGLDQSRPKTRVSKMSKVVAKNVTLRPDEHHQRNDGSVQMKIGHGDVPDAGDLVAVD